VIFLEPKRIYRLVKQDVPDNGEALPLDTCFILRPGSDITLVSWGAMLHETMQAADALSAEGIDAEVVDLATIKPLDMESILESVSRTGRCVIVHEAARNCGVGAEIAARLAEEGLMSLFAPIRRVAGYDTVMPMFQLEDQYMPSTDRIVQAVKETMEFA